MAKKYKEQDAVETLTKKERRLRVVAIIMAFLATYFFFVKLLFL